MYMLQVGANIYSLSGSCFIFIFCSMQIFSEFINLFHCLIKQNIQHNSSNTQIIYIIPLHKYSVRTHIANNGTTHKALELQKPLCGLTSRFFFILSTKSVVISITLPSFSVSLCSKSLIFLLALAKSLPEAVAPLSVLKQFNTQQNYCYSGRLYGSSFDVGLGRMLKFTFEPSLIKYSNIRSIWCQLAFKLQVLQYLLASFQDIIISN